MAVSGNVTDDEHSSSSELSVKLEFECFEEEEIHLEGVIAGYYCIENLDFDHKLPQYVELSLHRSGTPPTIFLRASERV